MGKSSAVNRGFPIAMFDYRRVNIAGLKLKMTLQPN